MYTLRIRTNPLFHKVKQLPQKYNINHPKESNTPQTPDSDLKILFTSPKKAPHVVDQLLGLILYYFQEGGIFIFILVFV